MLIDPLLSGSRNIIANLIVPGNTILDIGCGTGELVFYLSRQAKKAVGLDKNALILKYARIKKKRLKIENVEFISKDANDADFFSETHYGYAVFSMVLHQFSLAEANQILNSIKKLTKYIILADFTYPLPENVIGWGARFIERIAGGKHYLHFREYQKQGGLKYFLDYHQLAIIDNRIGGLGAIRVIKAVPKHF